MTDRSCDVSLDSELKDESNDTYIGHLKVKGPGIESASGDVIKKQLVI